MLKDRLPGSALAQAFPHAPAACSDINPFGRITGHRYVHHASARTRGSHRPPGDVLEKILIERLTQERKRQDREEGFKQIRRIHKDDLRKYSTCGAASNFGSCTSEE